MTVRTYHIQNRPGDRVLAVGGEIDAATAGELRDWLDRGLAACRAGDRVVLDLAAVDFFAVAGVHELVRAAQYAHEAGAALVLGPRSKAVDLVLRACMALGDLPVLRAH